MNLVKSAGYQKSAARLPKKIRMLLSRQEKILAENIFDSRLHLKKLKELSGEIVFSFRVTREYRGVFFIENNLVVLFMVGLRKDIYRSL